MLTFSELTATPCLVLLGEPGIGKSFALTEALNQTKIVSPSARIVRINLGTYGEEGRLINDVFQSTEFKEWSTNGGELHLFLDSFDECLMRIDTLGSVLKEMLAKLVRVQGLFFRITSRTAEWRSTLESAMRPS